MGISFWQIAIVVVLVVLLFGRGKISSLMGDVAKGIKSFKKGMSDDTSTNNQDTIPVGSTAIGPCSIPVCKSMVEICPRKTS